MADDNDDEIRALRERLERLEGGRPSAPTSSSTKAKSAKGVFSQAVIGVCLAVGALMMIGQCANTGGTQEPSAPAWAPPEGYSTYPTSRGDLIGTKWEDTRPSDCRGSGVKCWTVMVITPEGCDRSLYMSISLFDNSGQNVGWTNDTAQGVGPMEPIRLVFDSYERSARTARIAEVSCY